MKSVFCSVLFVVASVSLSIAQGTYTQISFPGANSTFAHGIDSSGEVVGDYTDTIRTHGFILSAGIFTTVDYPGALSTYLLGINDNGQIVGATESVGFIYDRNTQHFTTVVYPDGSYTLPFGINNAGTVVGVVEHSNVMNLGFELTGSGYKLVKGPIGGTNTQLFAIDSLGIAVGYDATDSSLTDFAVNQIGKYRDLTIPAPNASVYGISPKGSALIGAYALSANTAAGFVYQNRLLTTLQFPGATDTYAYGINDSGVVVGTFHGQQESFIWTAFSDPSSKP